MLIRLRLLGFLVVYIITGSVYAEDKQSSPVTTQPEPTKVTTPLGAPATNVTPVELVEPKFFVPIELPKPVVTEVVTKTATTTKLATPAAPITSATSAISAAPCVAEPVPTKVVAKAIPKAKPITNKKSIAPKKIAIKSDAVTHPVIIEKVSPPEQIASIAPEKVLSDTTNPQEKSADAMQPQYTNQHEENGLTYNNAAPIVESSPNKQCADTTNRLKKSLLVMAFPRLTPTTSSAGDLYQAEQQLPQLLSELLVGKHSTITPQQLDQALPSPDASTGAQVALLTQRLASTHRSQFILSGEIVDMSMTTPDATYNPGLYTRVINKFFDVIEAKNRFDKRDRLFSFQLHLRDGFTGEELLTKRYDTFGIWGYAGKVGFGTPLFWKSDYGQQIKGLVNLATNDLSQAINCQPFITQIDSRPGQTQFILQSGANNGLHTGDMLSLYQLIIQGSETRYQEHDVRLVNRNIAIELREVYASHSVGVINGTTYLTGKLVAVAK